MEARRYFLTLLLLPLLLFSGCKKEVTQVTPGTDFESLMGKDLPEWKYVQTEEDFQNLEFFKNTYEKNLPHLENPSSDLKIPKVIHYIWLGPKPFPRESVEYVRSWIAHHPDWTFKFWTDRQRALPHPRMEMHLVKDFLFYNSEPFFHDSDNFGEQSDLLRNEILYREGGIYVDHDVKCFNNFEKLNQVYDLYCGMELPYPTALSSSVLPTNNLIGARSGHPVLLQMMDWLGDNWYEIGKNYPGKDRDAVINRVAHRTFFALGKAFKEVGNSQENRDIAFPTLYFNSPKEEWALFAQHQYDGTWFENKTAFEQATRKSLRKMTRKINQLLLGIGVLAGLNLLTLGAVLVMLLKRRQAALRS